MTTDIWIGYIKIERLLLFKTTGADLTKVKKGYIPLYIGNSLYLYLFEEMSLDYISLRV